MTLLSQLLPLQQCFNNKDMVKAWSYLSHDSSHVTFKLVRSSKFLAITSIESNIDGCGTEDKAADLEYKMLWEECTGPRDTRMLE